MAGADLSLSVRSDLRATALRLEARIGSKQVDLAAARALNRAATTVRAETSKQIRVYYNLKASVIKAQMRILKASRRKLYAEIVASGRRIPLIEFVSGSRRPWAGGRRRRIGVKAQIQKAKIVTYAHAFIAQMPNGHIGIFERTGRGGRRGKAYLERIKQLVGISVPKAMAEKKVSRVVARVAAERFKTEFERELRYRLGG